MSPSHTAAVLASASDSQPQALSAHFSEIHPVTTFWRSQMPGTTTVATANITPIDALPDSAMLRLAQFARHPENKNPIIPASPASIWRWVKAGRFPAPVKLGPNTTAWRVADLRAWLQTA